MTRSSLASDPANPAGGMIVRRTRMSVTDADAIADVADRLFEAID
jgi:hypothetical protein